MAQFIGIVLAILGASPAAHATLGELEYSVNSDVKAFASSQKVTRAERFSVHTLSGGPSTVKEFVSPDGMVFAVSWRGMKPPDLSVLFGKYFKEYDERFKNRARRQRRGSSYTVTSQIVVMTGGHMGDLRGLAIVPSLLPPGVEAKDLQ